MAAEKTFSRINAGESMAFPGRCVAAYCTLQWVTHLWPGGVVLRDGSLRSALFAAYNTPGPKASQPSLVAGKTWLMVGVRLLNTISR